MSNGFRVKWDRPTSVGYDTYFPSNAYGMNYYRVEVSADPLDFQTLNASVTCVIGQNDPVCYFDWRIASVTGLTAGHVYYYRVLGGTIIGDGQYTTTLTSPTIPEPVACPVNTQCSSCMFLSDCVCRAGYYGNNRDNCTACVIGTYKQSTGFGSCVSCPGNTTTSSIGSVSVSDCVCPFGTYMESVSLQTCASCPGNTSTFRFGSVNVSDCDCAIGTYMESVSLQTCTPCPSNTTTLSTGSVSISDCVCKTGYSGNDGESCTACAAGTYKESSGSGPCVMCPANTLSLNTASVSIFDCVCVIGYGWNESYPLRRLMQQDVCDNCLGREDLTLVTDSGSS